MKDFEELDPAARTAFTLARMERLAKTLGARLERIASDPIAATIVVVGTVAGLERPYRISASDPERRYATAAATHEPGIDFTPLWDDAGGVDVWVRATHPLGTINFTYHSEGDGDAPPENGLLVRDSIFVVADTPEERRRMALAASRLPPAWVGELRLFYAQASVGLLDIVDDGVECGFFGTMSDDGEDWGEYVGDLPGVLAAMARFAMLVESPGPALGEEATCAYCAKRFALLADCRCPHCGAPAS